ncbi:hypothetical protein CF060_13640 [Clostridium botulinum]|uniref:hypothetical protein n=1 Tax=Clostridium botulinum TaxID=1491 RepID=UPI0009474E7F|nr:hypothetical protein [Clostridium botulinum]APQ77932.1 hypothetical protein RSJ10_434 [Clostridium botulinum]AUM97754.1 hypothetical protein RSJ13_01420 [Clostridium botulinum]MBN3355478.1 hypothetical protein [Clostridium botulinum]QDY27546.1 hypothetical protein CGQ41_01455 [Clostridium botulinum]
MQKYNTWGVPFSTIVFFERLVKGHSRVINVTRDRDIFFRIERDDDTILNTLLLNEYRFGIASLSKALEEFPETKYIVIGGNWNQSTLEADNYAEENRIGIYNFSEFLGAIQYDNPHLKYIKKDDRENQNNTFRGA